MTAHHQILPHEKGVWNYIYMAINTYLHINPCPIWMQAHENKTLHTLDRTINDVPVGVWCDVRVCAHTCVHACIINSNYEQISYCPIPLFTIMWEYIRKSKRKNFCQNRACSIRVSCHIASPTVHNISCKFMVVEGRHVKLHLKDDKWKYYETTLVQSGVTIAWGKLLKKHSTCDRRKHDTCYYVPLTETFMKTGNPLWMSIWQFSAPWNKVLVNTVAVIVKKTIIKSPTCQHNTNFCR
jgi:hypothetical protein